MILIHQIRLLWELVYGKTLKHMMKIFLKTHILSQASQTKIRIRLRYQSNFDKIPNNLNYLTHDLLKLFEFIENEGDFLNAKFEGILGPQRF